MSSKGKQKLKDWQKRIQNSVKKTPFGPIKMYRNEEGRLHRDDGPAYVTPTMCIDYVDGRMHGRLVGNHGTCLYYYEGVSVPQKFIESPEDVTFDEVINHPNTEVRCVGIKLYGFERMLEEERLDVLEVEKDGDKRMLLAYKPKNSANEDEAFNLVRVMNSTPEPDGTHNIYYLIVPPTVKSCQEGVAWTFYKKADEYHPELET